MQRVRLGCVLATAILLGNGGSTFAQVELVRTPDGGLQPQSVIDADGTVHLVYFKGDAKRGDLFYVRRGLGDADWSQPQRVNSEPGSARRNGAISHAQVAVGADSRVHVSWFNMRPAKYYYARTNDSRDGFETQRNLVTKNVAGVETGGSVATDGVSNVALVWHAGDVADEASRGVYARISTNHGRTFGPETRIDDDRGVCACCGLSAVWSEDALYVIYRAATDFVHRDMTLLKSVDGGKSFEAERVHEWNIGACPVSTTSITAGPRASAVVAWETMGQVFVSRSKPDSDPRPVAAPGEQVDRRKNPVAVVGRSGETLLVWGDGPGWRSGGTLHWQLFDAKWTPTDVHGQAEEMPEYSVPTAVARPDGSFLVIY